MAREWVGENRWGEENSYSKLDFVCMHILHIGHPPMTQGFWKGVILPLIHLTGFPCD